MAYNARNPYMFELLETATKLAQKGKGLLAADESTGTIGKRLGSVHLDNTPEHRQQLRELLFTTHDIEHYLSGVILYEETLSQKAKSGETFPELLISKGIVPGIKVDLGTLDQPFTCGEKITQGLDGLEERCEKYYEQGARFAKWRAVLQIQPDAKGLSPSDVNVKSNVHLLARYAAICQRNGLVPIVEPELLMTGCHSIEACATATERVLDELYTQLREHMVMLEGTVLKPNMVISGMEAEYSPTPEEIATMTVRCLQRTVPCAVPSIMFLSGGQSEEDATRNLNAINSPTLELQRPWTLSFSYGRALQASVLKAWSGKDENIPKAQQVFLERCRANSLAQLGKYSAETPSPAGFEPYNT